MITEDEEDLELIKQIQQGNQEAFETLMGKYQHRIFHIVSKYIYDPGDALDVSQEVFIKVYRSLENFRGDSKFYTWIYRIAINCAKTFIFIRNKNICDMTIDLSELENVVSSNNNNPDYGPPENILSANEVEEQIFKIIDDMPDDMRSAILLREVEGLSYQDISAVLGCPVGTVRSRIHRARSIINERTPK